MGDGGQLLHITVVICVRPGGTAEYTLQLPEGATVADALTVSATDTLPGWLDVTVAAVGACCAIAGAARKDNARTMGDSAVRMI